jgi:hypothetical protein
MCAGGLEEDVGKIMLSGGESWPEYGSGVIRQRLSMNDGDEYYCPEDNHDVVAHDALSIRIKSGVIGYDVPWSSYLIALSPSPRGFGFGSQSSKQSTAPLTAVSETRGDSDLEKEQFLPSNVGNCSSVERRGRGRPGKRPESFQPRVNKRHGDPFQGSSIPCGPIKEHFPHVFRVLERHFCVRDVAMATARFGGARENRHLGLPSGFFNIVEEIMLLSSEVCT